MPPAIGIIQTVAGTGEKGYAGDGGLAIHARMSEPFMCAFDAQGHLYVAEATNHCIRRIDQATGVITTVAGTGAVGYSGDGGPATRATLNQPYSLQIDTQWRHLHRGPAECGHPEGRGGNRHYYHRGRDRRAWVGWRWWSGDTRPVARAQRLFSRWSRRAPHCRCAGPAHPAPGSAYRDHHHLCWDRGQGAGWRWWSCYRRQHLRGAGRVHGQPRQYVYLRTGRQWYSQGGRPRHHVNLRRYWRAWLQWRP